MNKSFTLIEILVVIVIVGIISAFIIVSMAGVSDKARTAKNQTFSSSLRNSLLASLVSEWKFDGPTDEGVLATNSDILDSWDGNNGDIGANPPIVKTGTNCVKGKCMDFDGTDLLYLTNNANLSLPNTITTEFWLYPKDYYVGYASRPFRKYTSTSDANFVLYFFGTTAGGDYKRVRFYATAGGSWTNVSNGSPLSNLNKWYYFVWTYSATAGGLLYVNSTPIGSPVASGTLATNSANVILGEGFSGLVDEIRIYNEALPASRIKENYYSGINSLLSNNSLPKGEYFEELAHLK
ncbi:MAG: LamG domain-containing protein [Candidatus Paceibacterota bacterium]|jgi:prepilin-type N-terminal cleavage/methylation domain-containing protein|nr:LamG domain-containing protein [Candidatus Paceibacterota bacterium]MDD5555450.1 LamG domain-containing protein [Candidatus Paceibacterota bacterium]